MTKFLKERTGNVTDLIKLDNRTVFPRNHKQLFPPPGVHNTPLEVLFRI